jgi:hypothetical protein
MTVAAKEPSREGAGRVRRRQAHRSRDRQTVVEGKQQLRANSS